MMRRYMGIRITENLVPYFVWERNQHERMPRPYMQVIRIQKECRIAICVRACRQFEFKVLMGDIFLMVVHSVGAQGINTVGQQADEK
jgi:hypothetical protein